MLGPIMRVTVSNKLTVKLAPFARDDVDVFVRGLQSHYTGRYLTTPVQTLESEQEWYDRMSKDPSTITWGIWVEDDKTSTLIGSTSLANIKEKPLAQVTSGSLIADKTYWGRGIASATHKARTWYAFTQMNLVRIKSAVLLPNIGSKKALSRSGYFVHSVERNVQFLDGQLVDQENLECLNPSNDAWRRWWHGEHPNRAALEARKVTREALTWADQHIELP